MKHMQIKINEDLAAKFAAAGAKTPEEIIATINASLDLANTPPPAPPVSAEAFTALTGRVDALAADTALSDRLTAMEAQLAGVTAEAKQSASAAVTAALAGSGLPAPVGGGATDAPPAPPKVATFSTLVAQNMASGMNRTNAISAAIKTDAKAYGEWLASGQTNKL